MSTRIIERKLLIQQNMKLSFLEKTLPRIEKGITYTMITQKVINPYGFILEAIKQNGPINNLIIATYSINQKAISILMNLLDDKLIKDFTLLVNCNIKFQMKGKDVELLAEEKKRDNFHIIKKYSHAKVTLIDQDNVKIVISGSGNYSENPRHEQYTINDDKELYEFYKRWIYE